MSSTVGKINGQVLENNLLRNGVDLAFDTDLIYLDVDNGRIGINTDTPFRPLLVNGTLSSTNVLVDTGTISNFSFSLNTITNDVNDILISASGAGARITAGGISTDGISVDANGIRSLRSNEDIDLVPAGSGQITLLTNTEVNGSVHVTGDVTFDGNIVFGNNDLDSVSLSADINSNINPDQTTTYDLGASTKRWDELRTNLVNGEIYASGGAFVNGINLNLRQGNTWYVAVNGSYDNVGDHPNGPFDTIEKALTVATAGDTILIYPGTYYELLPLTVPTGVTVKGTGIRSVTIKPDTASTAENVFLLNGETTVEDLTVSDFFYDSINDTGYAFSFAPGFTVTSRSPYVRNVTVITTGSITSGTDPRGFAAGDAGKGAKVDGSLALAGTNEASMLFYSCTFICPGVDAITMTNGVRVEWLNSFAYFALRGLYATQGSLGLSNLGIRFGAEIRAIGSANVYGTYGAVADGADTLMYLISHNFGYIGTDGDSSNDPSLVIEANQVVELNSGVIYYDSVDHKGDLKVGSVFKVEQTTGKIIFQSVQLNNTSLIVTNGPDTTYIDAFEVTTGNITVSGNTIQSNTGVITLTAANNDLDVTSNLTVDRSLTVNQLVTLNKDVTIGNAATDTIYFNARINSNIIPKTNNLDLGINANRWKTLYTAQATFDDILINTNFISTTLSNSNLELGAVGTGVIRFDALDVSANSITSAGTNTDININPNGTGKIQLLKNTDITGNLGVTGNITLGGSIQIGDAIIDSIDPVGKIGSNLIPNTTGIYDIGSTIKTWRTMFVSELITDDILINTNFISTTLSNSNLELRANSTGSVRIDTLDFKSNTISSNTTDTDINIDPNGTGKIQLLKNTDITGNLGVTGDITVGGNIQLGDVTIDSIDPIGKIGSNLIPNTTGTYDIGSTTKVWRNLFMSNLVTDDIEINDNYIRTTASNSNLELRANGTGVINITDSLSVVQNLTINSTTNLKNTVVSGNLTTNDLLTITNNLTATGFAYGDIVFADNYITTTQSNSSLELRANGTGNVVFDNVLQITNSTISNSVISGTESDRSIIFNPVSGKSVAVQSTKALQLPIGNNTDRTLTNNGEIRYNNTSSTFEGKITGRNISLYNLFDTDGNTGISPELTPGANDDTIRMYANGVLSATITAQAATFNRIIVDEIDINNNIISTINSNADLELERSGSGIVNIKDSISITDNIITNTTIDAVTQIVSTGNGYVKFVGTGAIRIPHGLTGQQPVTAPIGATRYNTTTFTQEVYNGTAWISAAGTGVDVVSAEEMELISDLYGLLFG
jgi:hypothetical protein